LHSCLTHERISAKSGAPLKWIRKLNLSSEPLLSSLASNFQEVGMENHVGRAVGIAVGVDRAEDAETKKEWVAPELRKFEVAEVTANGGIFSSDGITSS